MSHRSLVLVLAVLTGVVISLASMSAAAQAQTQTTVQFEPIVDPRAFCPEGSDRPATSKERLMALPTKLIEPKKTPEGWPDLQGTWSFNPYPGSANHSVEVGVDPIDVAVQCQPVE